MQGYFMSNEDSSGTLKISVKNIKEFLQLLEDAEEKALQAKTALDKLSQFELEVTFDAQLD